MGPDTPLKSVKRAPHEIEKLVKIAVATGELEIAKVGVTLFFV